MTLENPVLVEVTRGDYVESVHRGAIAVADSNGKLLISLGDIEKPVFPRSAIKPFQALYLVESGAIEGFGLSKVDIALSCASHNGEVSHTDGVTNMLKRAGLTTKCLECGAQWPSLPTDRGRLMKADEKPDAVHNNCSGKHAGFICATHHLGENVEGYINPDHSAQKELKGIMESLSGYRLKEGFQMGRDGCSVPNYAIPLKNLALASARFAAASNLGAVRDAAAARIHEACTTHPHEVAGTNRFDTDVMNAFGDVVLVKTGAEGVYCGTIPSLGFGIALKCEDGATRAAEAMMAACLQVLLKDHPDMLANYTHAPIKNRNGWETGAVQMAEGVLDKLKAL